MAGTAAKALAIIVAAGAGRRLGGRRAKQFLDLCGEPLLIHTIRVFERSPSIGDIILVLPAAEIKTFSDTLTRSSFHKVTQVIPGGRERPDSVRAGLEGSRTLRPELILVHDGVRPFVDESLIERVLRAAREHGAAIPGLGVSETVKRAREGFVCETLDREELYLVQTPQAFRAEVLWAAFDRLTGTDRSATDEASIVEAHGYPVAMVEGTPLNIKITRPEDWELGELLLRARAGKIRSQVPHTKIRIGIGFDVHRLVEGRRLILGGVVIPFEKGLAGHSDADVLLHSISDAMLGALALGDLGRHFPDTDPRYEGISSLTLIRLIADLLHGRGYRVDSVDANVIADEPKLASHVEKMRLKIARALEIDLDSVSVKAKTHEGLGPLGNAEAIAAQAVCVLLPVESRS